MWISLNIHKGRKLFTCRAHISLNASLNKQLGTYTSVDNTSSIFCPISGLHSGFGEEPSHLGYYVLSKGKYRRFVGTNFLLNADNSLIVVRVSYQNILM